VSGRDVGAHQRALSFGAMQASAVTSATETQAVFATAAVTGSDDGPGLNPVGVYLTLALAATASAASPAISQTQTQAVAATASAASVAFVSHTQTQAVAATASAVEGLGVAQTQAVAATSSAASVVSAVAREAVLATGTASSSAIVARTVTQAVLGTASAEDGFFLSHLASPAVLATASAEDGYVVGDPDLGTPLPGLYEAMHNTVRAKFQADIVDAGHATTVVYDNEREAPPADQTWVGCDVLDEDTLMVGSGRRQTFRKRGILRATVYRPLGLGDAASLRICDAIRAAFDRAIDGGVVYGATSIGGFERGDQFYEVVASTPFYQDDRQVREANTGSWSLLDREAAFNAVRSRFDSLFGQDGAVSPTTVVYDNAPTKPPIDQQWIHFSIQTGETDVVGAGVNSWARTVGIATAMILTPLGRGDQKTLRLADNIAARFRSVIDSGVVYETPYLVSIGRRGQWFQTNANIRFRIEEVLT